MCSSCATVGMQQCRLSEETTSGSHVFNPRVQSVIITKKWKQFILYTCNGGSNLFLHEGSG